MKNKVLAFLLLAMILIFTAFAASADTNGNQVNVKFSNIYDYTTQGDSIENVPLPMGNRIFIDLVTSAGSLTNPKVVLNTGTKLDYLWPDDPSILSQNLESGIYTWNNHIEMPQGLSQAFVAIPADSFITARPGVSMSRAVCPETLSEGTTVQKVTVSFKLEESLPQGVNRIFVIIGDRRSVYQGDLVVSHAVDMADVEDWSGQGTGNGSALWAGNPSDIQVGKTYTFQADVETVKSSELSGTPVFKPFVTVIYSNTQDLDPVNSNSITLANPAISSNVTISADNEVQWMPQTEISRFDISMGSYASEITPYPYHVIVPADTVIDPKTMNLENQGNGVFTAFIKLPAPYKISDILTDTVKCQTAHAIRCSIEGDTLIAKFYRKDLYDLNKNSRVALEVTGSFNDGSIFRGSGLVRVK